MDSETRKRKSNPGEPDLQDFEIRELVSNPVDPDLQETYDTVNDLVNRAGNVTIRDLFTKGREEIGFDAWEAIQRAKGIGFLQMNNDSCCSEDNDCVRPSNGDWCSRSLYGGCAAASDHCQ